MTVGGRPPSASGRETPLSTSLLRDPALLDALPDAVVVADHAGRIAFVNPAIRTLLGHDPGDLVGQPLQVLMPARFRHAHGDGFSRFRATGTGRLVGTTTRVPALHASGQEIQIDLTLARLTPHGIDDALVVAVLRDASSTVLLERQLEVGRYLAATLRVTAALTEASDADVAFEGLLPTLCEHLDWEAAALWQPDGAELAYAGTWTAPGELVPALQEVSRGRRFARGVGLPGQAWQRRSPVVALDLWSDRTFLRAPAARSDGIRTGVAFPVLQGDTTLAVVELFSRSSRAVPPELVDVLAGAGRQIGQYLGRLRAEAEVRRLADTLQRSFLPSTLPVIPGVEIAAGYRAGGEQSVVGGDTYDVMALPDGHWMVLIADVCGTGPAAAANTALTRHTARAVAVAGDPAEILGAVSSALLAENSPAGFVTACCLLLSPDEPSGVFALAGHPQPLLRTAAGEVQPLGRPGLPLGVDADAEYAVQSVALAPGDTVVLYTDGVTEARDVHGEQFGEDALAHLLRATAGSTPAETVAAVRSAVDRHLAGAPRAADDLAVVALRV